MTKEAAATAWLERCLLMGKAGVPAGYVQTLAEEAGYSASTIRRAFEAHPHMRREHKPGFGWFWIYEPKIAPAVRAAMTWLSGQVTNAEGVPVVLLMARAVAAGINWQAVKRCRRYLPRIQAVRRGGRWHWVYEGNTEKVVVCGSVGGPL